MILALPADPRLGESGAEQGPHMPCKEQSIMRWEVPSAVDFRYGMEITLYIANR